VSVLFREAGSFRGHVTRVRPLRLISIAIGIVAAGCTVSAAPTTTTTTAPGGTGPATLILSQEGLLPHHIGDAAATVVAEISDTLGGYDREFDWERGTTSPFGDCPAVEVRGFGWGSLVLIEAGAGGRTPGTFLTWTYGFDHETGSSGDPRGLQLRTREGIGIGSPVTELEAVYGSRVEITTDSTADDITNFVIDGSATEHLRGRLSGPDHDAVVDFIERVPGCSS